MESKKRVCQDGKIQNQHTTQNQLSLFRNNNK